MNTKAQLRLQNLAVSGVQSAISFPGILFHCQRHTIHFLPSQHRSFAQLNPQSSPTSPYPQDPLNTSLETQHTLSETSVNAPKDIRLQGTCRDTLTPPPPQGTS